MKRLIVIAASVFALMLPVSASATPYYGEIDDFEFADIWQLTVGTAGVVTIDTSASPVTDSSYPLDTQLFLFDSSWMGLWANDNANSSVSYSQISAFLNPGSYFLAVSLYNANPVNLFGNIFPDNLTGQVAPTFLGSLAPFTGGWSTAWPEGYPYNGPYVLDINGVDAAAPVPEPATLTLLATGALGLVRRAMKRRQQMLA
jgi:hypothetical protein